MLASLISCLCSWVDSEKLVSLPVTSLRFAVEYEKKYYIMSSQEALTAFNDSPKVMNHL